MKLYTERQTRKNAIISNMKKKLSSQFVECPICQKEYKTRGLHAHLRLQHPEVDAKQKLRDVIIDPKKDPEQRIIFEVSLTQDNEYVFKHTELSNSDMLAIIEKIHSLLLANLNKHN